MLEVTQWCVVESDSFAPEFLFNLFALLPQRAETEIEKAPIPRGKRNPGERKRQKQAVGRSVWP